VRALRRLGLLPAAGAAWLAALLLTSAPSAAGWVAATGLLLGAAGVGVRLRRGPGVRGALPIAAVPAAVGAVALAVLGQVPLRSPDLPTATPLAVVLRVEGVSSTSTNDAGGGLTQRLLLNAVLVHAVVDGRQVDSDAPVLAFPDAMPAAARAPGALVSATAVLTRADAGEDVAYRLSVHGRIRVVAPPDAVQGAAGRLRAGFATIARTLPGDGGALLPGLAIGDTSRVPQTLKAAMKASSLSHLTAVSGANCAVVTIAVFTLAGLLRLPRAVRVLAAVLALVGFVVLVTPQPSVLRSAAMALLALGCIAAGRTAAGLPALGVAVLVLLVPDPWLGRDPGFALSVLATAGLLALTRPIAARLARVLPDRLALLLAVPIAAQVACQPVLILLQPSIPVFGVAANLLAEPAAPLATILGLVACLAAPVLPPVAATLAAVGWVPAAWIAAVARCCAGLPAMPWLPGVGGAALVALLVVAAAVALDARRREGSRAIATGVVVLAGIGIVGGWAGNGLGRLARPADWEIAACDIGQGDGLVLNGGGGHFLVVDTGRRPAPMTACLAALGVGRVDLLVLTHWDADHVGAARALVGRVTTAFVGPRDGPAADELRTALGAGGARVEQVHRGQHARVGRLRLDVLWPPDPLGAIEPGNPASITLLVHGRLTSLFTGDLGEEAQDAVLAAGPLPHVDVVKVAHHGSADQSPAFYRAADAQVGLVSVGSDNDYGHPTARALRILASVGTQPFRTDQDGLLLVTATPAGVSVWSEHPVTAAVWRPAK
jgi:competence protein ComEC